MKELRTVIIECKGLFGIEISTKNTGLFGIEIFQKEKKTVFSLIKILLKKKLWDSRSANYRY